MSYTIQSAQWAVADNTAAILQTTEAGAVVAAPERAEAWQALQDWIAGGDQPAAYAPPPPPTESERLEQYRLAQKVLAALTIRASTQWGSLSAARRNRVQQIIDNAAAEVIALLS